MANVVKHWRVWLLGAVVSVVAILIIASQINLDEMVTAFQNATPIHILESALLVVAGLFFRAVRWRVLLSGGLPLGRAFNIINVTYLANGILPLRLGEAARMFLATRADPPVPVFKSASTIIVERLLDVLAVLVILALSLSAAPLPDWLRTAASFSVVLVIFGFLTLVILASQRDLTLRIIGWFVARIALLQRVDLVGWAGHFLDGLKPLTQPSALFSALLWTTVAWGFSLLSGYILMQSFYETPDWVATLLFTAAASFAVAVPAVPGNVGPYEAAIIASMSALGYESLEVATAFALAVHGVNLLINAILGTVGITQEGISLRQLVQGVRGMQTQNIQNVQAEVYDD
ncbi:MAG: flippase-like domain-containing protein [Chloroflexi bacterium]|nr:flippase-like domain-containing protein [Chloroflexota bacterium]